MMEANSNTVVSSLEMILLAVDNIYEKCAKKSAWTQHGDLKEFSKYDNNDKNKKNYIRKEFKKLKLKLNTLIIIFKIMLKSLKIIKKLKNNKPINKIFLFF